MVRDLAVPVSVARQAARASHDLPAVAAGDADRQVAAWAARGGRSGYLTRRRVETLVAEARLYHDPDRAVDDEHQALAARKVRLWPGTTPATTDVSMCLDTADAEAFNTSVSAVADRLARLGDHDPLEIRRARAVGGPGRPRPGPGRAHRRHRPHQAPYQDGHQGPHHLAAAGHLVAAPERHQPARHRHVRRRRGLRAARGAVHRPGQGLAGRLHRHHPTRPPRPPRHTRGPTRPTSRHGRPVRLRDPVCVFPGCSRPSRACDLDHIEAYIPLNRGGPSGQTNLDNLAPLCRRHHRVKTHTAGTYRRRPDGTYHWTSPTGRTYDVLPPPPLR
jgi:hypothetical protein